MAPPDPTLPESLLEHSDFVRALARSLVHGEPDAEDLVQETWLASLKSPPTAPGRERSWLAAVVRNFARQAGRSGARRRAREEATARREGIPSTAEVLAREEQRRRVVAAVLELEETYRAVILLRYFEDLPPREIARRLGSPVETVRTRLKRALAQLRARLDGEHGDRRTWSLLLLPLAGRSPAEAVGPVLVEGTLVGTATKAALAAGIVGALALGIWQAWPDGSGPRVPSPPIPIPVVAGPAKTPATPPVPGLVDPEIPAFRGVLLDADSGAPVAGARVKALDPATGAPVMEGVTSADGRFVLPSPQDPGATLAAEKSGFGPVERRGATTGSPLMLRMRRLGRIGVRVRDIREDPVAGAEITVLWDGLRSRTAVSDAEGRVLLDDQEPGPFMVGALPPSNRTDLAQASLSSVLLPGESRDVELVLGAGISCTGHVVDEETRAPIPGAEVLAVFGPRFRTWLADGEGEFTYDWFWEDRPAWGAVILVRAEGFETRDHKFRPSKDREFVVPLRRAVSHCFRVTDPGGSPVFDARVVVYGTNMAPCNLIGEGRTDTSGKCSIRGFSPKEDSHYLIGAFSPDGKLQAMVEGYEGYPLGMRAKEALEGHVPIPLAACNGRLSVRVRSGTLPVEGRRVRIGCIPTGREYSFLGRQGGVPGYPNLRTMLPKECVYEGDTDPGGNVSFENLPDGACAVEVDLRSDRGWILNKTPGSAALEVDLDEALPETHEVRGVVRTKDGPVLHAFVHLVTDKGFIGEGTVTYADGRFKIKTHQWPPLRISVSVPQKGGSYRVLEFPLPAEGEEVILEVE